MDKRSTYSRVMEMMKSVEIGKVVHMNELRKLIMINIGSSERTIVSCLHIMNELGILEDLGNYKFKILKNDI